MAPLRLDQEDQEDPYVSRKNAGLAVKADVGYTLALPMCTLQLRLVLCSGVPGPGFLLSLLPCCVPLFSSLAGGSSLLRLAGAVPSCRVPLEPSTNSRCMSFGELVVV